MSEPIPDGGDADLERDKVKEIAEWLRHIDRLDEVSGARYPGLEKNPLWDASFLLEDRFGGGGDPRIASKETAAEGLRARRPSISEA